MPILVGYLRYLGGSYTRDQQNCENQAERLPHFQPADQVFRSRNLLEEAQNGIQARHSTKARFFLP